MRIVAIGGGHGLAATLAAARRITDDITAVVSVADDGGSSGRLRDEFSVLPPGDLRMALLALAGEEGSLLVRMLGHRFAGDGAVGGHSLGNLALTALWQQGNGVVESLDALRDLLGGVGRVLPVSTDAHAIEADVALADGSRTVVVGQARIAAHPGTITGVRTVPDTVHACAEALTAIADADLIVLGPGSWFTSVLAPLAVRGIADAIAASGAPITLVVNLRSEVGETVGFTTTDYLESLHRAHPQIVVNAVVEPVAASVHDSDVATGGEAVTQRPCGPNLDSGALPVTVAYRQRDNDGGHRAPRLAESLRDAANSLRQGQRG